MKRQIKHPEPFKHLNEFSQKGFERFIQTYNPIMTDAEIRMAAYCQMYPHQCFNSNGEHLLTVYLNLNCGTYYLPHFVEQKFTIQLNKIKLHILDNLIERHLKEKKWKFFKTCFSKQYHTSYTMLMLPTAYKYELFEQFYKKDDNFFNKDINFLNHFFDKEIYFKDQEQFSNYLYKTKEVLSKIISATEVSLEEISQLKNENIIDKVYCNIFHQREFNICQNYMTELYIRLEKIYYDKKLPKIHSSCIDFKKLKI